MKYKNTVNIMQKFGTSVVKGGRRILRNFKPYAKTTSRNTLYNDMDYLVTSSTKGVQIEFIFGGAEDYWQFVDKGVQGAGSDNRRGRGSPFKFKDKMPPRKAIDRWVVTKPLKAARKNGKFTSRKSLVFAIQKTIFERGLATTKFFTRPLETQIDKYADKIANALVEDALEKLK
jgi:hypothetical protein